MLDVDHDAGPAVALYDRLGWRLVDRRLADWATPEGVDYRSGSTSRRRTVATAGNSRTIGGTASWPSA